MATLLNVCPPTIDLCISRGDTAPWEFVVKEGGAVKDITGFTYKLTVDPIEDPTGAGNNLFELIGTVSVGTDGVVTFSLSLAQSDTTPAVYFYDLQQIDGASAIRTIAKGKFEFKQDITKAEV